MVGVFVAVGGTDVLVGSGVFVAVGGTDVFVAVGGIGVLVAVAGMPTVHTSRLQPAKLPPSRLALSSTRRVQVPLALCPSKADRALLGW